MCARAKEIPAQENNFRRLYLNQWTEQAARWISMPAWDACQRPIDRAALRGRRCYVGMDLSTTTDLTALVAVFPDERRGFDVLAQFFVPADRIRERSRRDHVPYDEWARQGMITATPGSVVDYEAIRAALSGWAQEFCRPAWSAFDPWNATDLVTRLGSRTGFSASRCGRGSRVCRRRRSRSRRRFSAGGCGTTAIRCCGGACRNVAVETDPAGNLKPSKTSPTERIDGVVALDHGGRSDGSAGGGRGAEVPMLVVG